MQLFCSLQPSSFHTAFWQILSAVYPGFCIFAHSRHAVFCKLSRHDAAQMRLQPCALFILHGRRMVNFVILWLGKAFPEMLGLKIHVIDAQSGPFCNSCRGAPKNGLQIPISKYAKNRSSLSYSGCCGHCITFFFGICPGRHTLDCRQFCCPIPA